ncbi:MAG: type II secretion system protein [Rhodocyclales bacterium]|nr:type II secretion system protein [Rhodocyclales bacterium]
MAARSAGAQRGFSYLLVLFFVAIVGAGLAAAGQMWVTAVQREREAELLFVGNEFRQAIGRYYEATPGRVKQFPSSLEDLLKDPRFPQARRHLRQIYVDPMSGRRDWLLVKAPQGGIMGVASASEEAPKKRSGFDGADRVFEQQALRLGEKLRYRDWEFVHVPGLTALPPQAYDHGGGN